MQTLILFFDSTSKVLCEYRPQEPTANAETATRGYLLPYWFKMSTFKGRLEEDDFKGCVIDYFKGEVLNEGKAFFLSHFHTDHMEGLEDVKFHELLAKDDTRRLYCSNITKKMLLKRRRLLGIPADRIVVIERDPIAIIPYDTAIQVTALRAGHCPGSVMFLFDTIDTTALYTGDFRLSKRDLMLCKPLHHPDTHKVIKLQSIYLDTTFADADYEHFPPREKSKDLIVREIRKHRTAFKYIVIEPTASTGIEYLMVELYKEFKCQMHASYDLCQSILCCIEHLHNVTTSDLSQSFIHFCTKTGPCHPCPKKDSKIDEKDILTIKPSAKYFNRHVLKHMGEVVGVNRNFLRVVYSSHSSMSEIADFVTYLKPRKIHPSVLGEDFTSADEVVFEIKMYCISAKKATLEEISF